MKRHNFAALLFYNCALSLGVAAVSSLPSAWQHQQTFAVPAAGLLKISLPTASLDAARPALEDLRLYDGAGNEVPYVIERPAPAANTVLAAKSFQVSLDASATVITLETGQTSPMNGVALRSPALDFLKAVQVESSDDGVNWQIIAQGRPIFRQPFGASHLQILFPAVVSRWLRLTVDDQRSQPVPFTGAVVHLVTEPSAPGEWISATISERDESPGETRLALDLGAAHLTVASVRIETGDPLFLRQVSIAVPEISQDSIREQTIGQGAIYRLAGEGQTPAENLSVPLDTLLPARELFLLIRNGDSPPLPISAVRVERRPVYLVFLARQAGPYHLLVGNPHCDAPRYDLAALGINLKGVVVSGIKISPLSDNPAFNAPEVLPGVQATGAALDVSDWKFRKRVHLGSGDAQKVELDLDVLSHAQEGFGDLRLLRDGNQVPYVIENTSISRVVTPEVIATNDAKKFKLSRWILKLPRARLPLTRLTCVAKTPLFDRTASLYEERTDERGAVRTHDLGRTSWVQTPERHSKEFVLTLDSGLESDTLFLEMENGDNPPVDLGNFQMFYPATRLLFKAGSGGELFLYYGNSRVVAPRYDLSLVGDQLLGAENTAASLSAEEQLKESSWRDRQNPGQGGILFWGVLALVVIGLLVIISRLLPKSPPPAN